MSLPADNHETPPSVRRALVTGASRGIGAAIAKRLAADGHEVVINFHHSLDAAITVRDEILATGAKAELARFDVGNRAEASAALAGLLTEGGPISVLVNNAGVIRDGTFSEMTWDDWSTVLRTTLDGFFNVTQPLVAGMVQQRFGRIINLSSISGVRGNRGQVNYSAAKAGIIGATKALALELGRNKITVNAIAPGLIKTEMIEKIPPAVITQIPARRLGTPDEVAGLISYLASDAAGYVTGQVLQIDGGFG
jgi:3-oxoacyl-[acyl-carrier protein] reductase